MNNLRNTFLELRGRFDSKDPFMSEGHQIVHPREVRQSDHKAPAWATDDKAVQKLLLLAFPKLRTHAGQRQRAGRWAEVIHLYFRMSWTAGQVATETGLKRKTVENRIASIRRVAGGLRADNKPRSSRRPGRPKKNACAFLQVPMEAPSKSVRQFSGTCGKGAHGRPNGFNS